MARSVILGNSGLTVGLNERGLVHDFYYPYVGLENLTTSRMQPHHVGLWVDGEFSWLNDPSWIGEVDFETDALVSSIHFKNAKLGISLHISDFVDVHHDVFARKMRITNDRSSVRDVRVFFHQVFQISALGRADTVMYVPDDNYILDYKGRCSLLAYAETEKGASFDQYAAGNAGIEGKEGTFRDAEDGNLSMSAVEHGGVDSTIRVKLDLGANETENVHYWLAVADSQNRLEDIHEIFLGEGFNKRLHACYQHWHDWLETAESHLEAMPGNYKNAIKKSLMTIKAHTDEHGGIIASCDSSIYNYGRDYYSYVWPRDGAYVMWPLIKLGFKTEPKAFFSFCKSILHPDGYLMHKYQPDRAIGSTWHPLVHGRRKELAIQEDETAIVVYMLSEYLRYSNDRAFVEKLYPTFIQPTCEFMVRFIDEQTGLPHASYDLWEEKFLTSTYSTAVVAAALHRASEIAQLFGQSDDAVRWLQASDNFKQHADTFYDENISALRKGFLLTDEGIKHDAVTDVSTLFAAWMFSYSKPEHIENTLARIEKELLDVSPSGGSPRYEDDNYFKSNPAYRGNPWFVTTLWLAQYYAGNNRMDEAIKYIDWTLAHALPSGVLSEQINPENGSIVGVTPLVWSHAELINAIIDLKQ